ATISRSVTGNPVRNVTGAQSSSLPFSPVTGSPVSFNGSSSTCYASPCSYNWTDDADSSVLGTGATMSFTFSGVGTKYVRLTITRSEERRVGKEHEVIGSSTVVGKSVQK